MEISIVSPIYKGEKMLRELVSRVEDSVSSITEEYEIILVNDQSPDNSWEVITHICEQDKKVKGVNLSRNFGQHYAISAGLSLVCGEWIVVMDCDLQDRPEEIPNLYKKAKEGYDIVFAQRIERHDSFLKRLSSTIFHSFFNWISGTKTDKSIGNFGVFNSQVIYEINRMPEKARDFVALIDTIGFKRTAIPVLHSERVEGSSSYTLYKLLKLSADIIISNTNKPLKLAVGIGFFMSLFSFLMAIYNVIAKLVGLIDVQGFTFTVFSIWFVGGILLLMLGIMGLYIGKIFDQVKDRQLFIIRDKINF